MGGLSLGGYASKVNSDVNSATGSANVEKGDPMSATWYANYNFGPVSVGYQTGGLDNGKTGAAVAATTA